MTPTALIVVSDEIRRRQIRKALMKAGIATQIAYSIQEADAMLSKPERYVLVFFSNSFPKRRGDVPTLTAGYDLARLHSGTRKSTVLYVVNEDEPSSYAQNVIHAGGICICGALEEGIRKILNVLKLTTAAA